MVLKLLFYYYAGINAGLLLSCHAGTHITIISDITSCHAGTHITVMPDLVRHLCNFILSSRTWCGIFATESAGIPARRPVWQKKKAGMTWFYYSVIPHLMRDLCNWFGRDTGLNPVWQCSVILQRYRLGGRYDSDMEAGMTVIWRPVWQWYGGRYDNKYSYFLHGKC